MDPTIPSPVNPTLGGPASLVYGTDWYPATVVLIATQMEFLEDGVTQRERPVIELQEDLAVMSGGVWEITDNPNGSTVVASKRDDGVWRAVGTDSPIVVPGIRIRFDS